MSTFPAFLSTLCEADVAALAERWTVRIYRQHELIIAHGDRDRDVFFILDGQARVTLFSRLGREVAKLVAAPNLKSPVLGFESRRPHQL